MVQIYKIDGMSCDGCARTVKIKLGKIDGVEEVTVDLDKQQATIVSQSPVSSAQVQKALEHTTYTLAAVQ